MTMDTHVQIDIETLGLKPGEVIVSIGAVRFNPRVKEIETYEEFFVNNKTLKVVMSISNSKELGFIVDPETQEWWDCQSDEARAATFDTGEEVSVNEGLAQLSNFLKKGDTVWGNGANFDPVLLEAYYHQLGIEVPWKFFKVKCFRTLKDLLDHNQLLVPANKIKHDCLADAVHQAQVTQAIYMANPQIKPDKKDK